ncbi:MAG: hypothetical protein UV76_C0002G0008 [Candidatus Nomurabacteria bacterium GW2011_GWA2_43_15]|uniref:DUF5652 domain-containing protein n=2 Tax=Candidatus Nomuraibacteriota TaxID=1752729 RepID=A0A0G1DTY7_9BACT|nr:MAG: hypothetical protein UV76_C0002G0008 [Candidatus Nomurabacteria bacterium GW2011_GWA2_43_15]KKT19702.1 MAG: hypothetical protein UW02_C0006G0008 [Candidatus Nomurabacteria bacterium GW2011_GWB1_43_7]
MNQLNPFVSFIPNNMGIFILILLWALFWKGCALWVASKNNQKGWFWIILVLNTVGILEIIYIFAVMKKKWSDLKEIFSKSPQSLQ